MRSSFAISTVLLAAMMAVAQANPTPNQTPNPSGATQAQSGAPKQSPSSAPSASAGNPQAPSSTPGGHKVLQAKSQDELKAYQDAASKTDPAQMEAAADAFATKYPDSDLKAALYIRTMTMYGQANNSEKVIELGRKAMAADPTDPVPLVQVGSALVEGSRETDMDREQRLVEAAKDAHAAIDNIDNLMVPSGAPAEQVAAVKANILTMAHDTLGMVSLNKKDYAGAEQEFLKAADASKAQPEAVVFLRLSVAQDELKQYPQALESANKAVQYAPEGSAAQNLAKQQQARLQKLIASSTPEVPSSIAPVTPAPDTPATPAPATPAPATPAPAQTAPAQTPSNPPH